jgi:hypothetical protein
VTEQRNTHSVQISPLHKMKWILEKKENSSENCEIVLRKIKTG